MTQVVDIPENTGCPEMQNSLVFRVDRNNRKYNATSPENIEQAAALNKEAIS